MRLRQDRKAIRQRDAAERVEYYAGLNSAQKIANLDAKLGKGVGAKKQRAKLNKLDEQNEQI